MTRDTAIKFNARIDKATSITAQGFTGHALTTEGTALIRLRITDHKGTPKEMEWKFHLIDRAVEPIILGYDWAAVANPDPNWIDKTWTWPEQWDHIERIPLDAMATIVESGVQVYYLHYDGVTLQNKPHADTDPNSYRVLSITTAPPPTVPTHLTDFADVFNNEAAGLVPDHGRLDHAIDVTENKEPPYGPLYNLSQNELQVLRDYLEDAEKKGWIRRSTSPAGAPVLFVPKKDGGLRLCVDYRGLNNVTIKNRHPLPLISETLDRLGGAAIFTKLDLKDAYHRIRIKEGDEWKTAFRTRYGHWEYLVMPFGLANAPATFQSYISQALVGLVDTICVIYLDDILIYSADRAQHHDDVKTILTRLRAWKLYANLKKCDFDCTRVEFLGFTIDTDGVTMERSRVDTITSWPAPKSYHDLQVFLGFANFYRRFIKNYSAVIRPLTDLFKGMQNGHKSGPFEWAQEQLAAFSELKRRFSSAPLLTHFDPSLPLLIETDASGFAIGAVLSQQRHTTGSDAHWHPIAYYSRKMIPAETRYETHDGEMLAIVVAFKQWRHYLEGAQTQITVKTDHDSLKSFMTKKELNKRQARWAEKLAAFDFVIEYRAGKSNPADGLSRQPHLDSDVDHAQQLLPQLQQRLLNAQPAERPRMQAGQVTPSHEVLFALSGPAPAIVAISDSGLSCPLKPWDHAHCINVFDSGPLGSAPQGEGEDYESLTDNEGITPQSSGDETPDPDDLTVTGPSALETEDTSEHTWETYQTKRYMARQTVAAIITGETAYDKPKESILETIAKMQRIDGFAGQVRSDPQPGRHRAAAWTFDSHNLLRYRGRLYVPPDAALREEIIRINHDDPHSSHFGARKTLHLLSRHYHWDSISTDVKDYVQTCTMCQRTKVARHLPYGKLASLPIPNGPWAEISMDFITDLPNSYEPGSTTVRDSILVIVDRYTKVSKYIPTNKTVTAAQLAEHFLGTIVRNYGVPNGIVSDRGTQFTSHFWSALCYYLKVTRRLSTAFHPQSDGQTERQNQTIEQYLRCYCNYEQNDWCSKIALAEFTYNNSVHSTTGMTPFMALYGYSPTIRINPEGTPPQEAPTAALRIERLTADRETLETRWRSAIASQQKHHNARHLPITFRIRDQVMLNCKNLKQTRPSRKLADKYLGPFRVIEIMGAHQQAYKLELPERWKVHPVFHVSLLEPYHGRDHTVVDPESVDIDAETERDYEVEAILADRIKKGTKEYLVRWKNYPPEDDSWEPEDNLQAQELVQEHEAQAELAPPAKRRRTRQ